jgi:hypothetical protein
MNKLAVAIVFLLISFSVQADYNFYTEKECPVVGNTKSRIYHVPRGQIYLRMLQKNQNGDNRRCFGTENEAKINGYRKSKS